MVKKKRKKKIWVEIFDFMNIVLPTRLNSSPRIIETHRWFLQTFTSRFIELPLRDLRVKIRVIIELSAITIANHIQTADSSFKT